MTVDDDDLAALVDGAEQHLADAAADEVLTAAAPVLMQLDNLLDRAQHIAQLRAAKDRGLGQDARDALTQIDTALAYLADLIEGDNR